MDERKRANEQLNDPLNVDFRLVKKSSGKFT